MLAFCTRKFGTRMIRITRSFTDFFRLIRVHPCNPSNLCTKVLNLFGFGLFELGER